MPRTPYLRVYQESALRRSSNASRYNLRGIFSRSGNISPRWFTEQKNLKLFVIWSSLPGNHGYEQVETMMTKMDCRHAVSPEPRQDHDRNGVGRPADGGQRAFGQAPKRIIVPEGEARPLPIRIRISWPVRLPMAEVASACRRSSPQTSSAAGCSRRSIGGLHPEKVINIDAAPNFQNWKPSMAGAVTAA